jgi:hypothetical protein
MSNKKIEINENQLIDLKDSELESINGGGFLTFVTGVVIAFGEAVALYSKNMRDADRASGHPLANKF